MKLYKILLFLMSLLFVVVDAQGQYNVMLGNKKEITDKSNNSNKVDSFRLDTSYQLEELSETSSAILSANNIFPTYSNMVKMTEKSQCNFMYMPTRTEFPYLIGKFVRKQIVVPKKIKEKILAIYKPETDLESKTSLVIQFVPAGFGTEGRLRDTFLKEMNDFFEEFALIPKSEIQVLRYNGNYYNSVGVRALFSDENDTFSSLTIYECGSWLMEIKIIKLDVELLEYQKFHNELVQVFNPAHLTSINPLYDRPNLDFNSDGLKEPLSTGALWAAAMRKINWASSEVSFTERAAGFPDLYLNMHIEAVKEYLKVLGSKKNLPSNSQSWRNYNDLLAIKNAGFLSEYIMEQYDNVMIVPKGFELNFDAYHQWKRDRGIQVDIRKKRYDISYRNLPY